MTAAASAPSGPGAPYHHLLRGPRFAWWRALLTLALAFTFALLAALGMLGGVALLTADGQVEALLDPDNLSPPAFALANALIALFIPASLLATRVVHGRGAGRLSSVAGRIRWNWLLRCMLALLPLYILYVTLDLFIDQPTDGRHAQWLAMTLVILASTPLQAAGEEYVARGLILQNVGAFFADTRHAAVVASVPAVLVFAAAHGSRDPWIFIDLAIFGGACTVLALRTGGLEAPIALHAMNNMVGMIVTLLWGGFGEGFVDGESVGEPLDAALTLVVCAIAVPMLLRLAVRHGIRSTAAPPPRATATAMDHAAGAMPVMPSHSPDPMPRRPVSEAIALLLTLLITAWLVQAMTASPDTGVAPDVPSVQPRASVAA